MNLIELLEKVQGLLESVEEDENDPSDIEVSIQIDDCDRRESIIVEDFELLYDNFGEVSGMCIHTTEVKERISFDNPHKK